MFRLEYGKDILDAALEWELPSARARAGWANHPEATEHGACALVLASVESALGLVAISRAETRSGADYYVAPVGSDPTEMESAIRLEISGVDSGSVRLLYGRVRRKIEQVLRGTGDLPAFVGVVGFGCKRIVLEAVEDSG